jgi:hypothetical protein
MTDGFPVGVEEGMGKRMPSQYKIVQEFEPRESEPESPVDEKNEHGIDMVILRAESFDPKDPPPDFKLGARSSRDYKSTYVRRRHHSDVTVAGVSEVKYGQHL